ncbi:SAM-dependent methyltransferase [Mycolicibacillus trivialis]
MKTADQLGPEKLRGGFYSPSALVQVCLNRISELTQDRSALTVLEPSAGDGAFIRGLAGNPLRDRVARVVAVELIEQEAAACDRELAESAIDGKVFTGSFFDPNVWSCGTGFDVAVGNPPFLRYQFVDKADQADIARLSEEIGVSLKRVSNLWIPLFLGSLAKLKRGGCFAFIIPAECLTGVSAKVARDWLTRNAETLQVDLFPVGSFPGVLQEVVVLSGRIGSDARTEAKITVFDHATGSGWAHAVDDSPTTWTSLLLSPHLLSAFEFARDADGVIALGSAARLSVATVTGANEFFSLDDAARSEFGLNGWTRPLLARTRQAAGLQFTDADLEANRASGAPTWLFDSSLGSEDPIEASRPREYIALGEASRLHERYKCRIRTPWYRVPVVSPGELMLSKRSHQYPRLIHNRSGVVTTDTIYQGGTIGNYRGRARDLVGSFHNSLTLLTAELFGRSFGGGVLELVPSEIKSLLVPLVDISSTQLEELDALVRTSGIDTPALVDRTDELISQGLPHISREVLEALREARDFLLNRRLERNRGAVGG